MSFRVIAFLIVLCATCMAVNAVITPVNCTNVTTINAALNAAANDDVIKCTTGGWSSGAVNIPATKNITLNGNGVTCSGLGTLFIPSSATFSARVTGFTFSFTQRYAITTGTGYTNKPWRFDHNTFTSEPVAVMGIYSGPGLMDHDNFNDIASFQQTLEPVYEGADSDAGWLNAHTPGSPNALYIEDCSFKHVGSIWDGGNVTEAQYGARVVYRYNTIDAVQIEFHGSPGAIGGRWWEIYDNTFVNNGSICLRAGSGVVFNNTGTMQYFVMLEEDSGYPALYQIGRGQNESLTPAYVWNMGQDPQLNAGGYCSNAASNMVQLNRDVYQQNGASCVPGGACTSGVGIGTTLPTSCTTGTAFWKTDAGGNWDRTHGGTKDGALYKCVNGVMTPYYVPYPYPHPLQHGP